MYREYPVTKILPELERHSLLPGILFRTSRRQCDNDVMRLSRTREYRLPVPNQLQLRDAVRSVIDKYQVEPEVIFEHPQYNALIHSGTGAHHAGQLLIWRILLEELMTLGLLRLMVATGTVAAGVDFPARTVIITAHSRRGSDGFRVLAAAEFQQMSGRAGRRGKDSVGMCLIAPSPFSDARVLSRVAKQPPEPLKSSYFASPSTVLNLLRYRSVDDLRYTVEKSLAAFLDRKAAKAIRADVERKQIELDQSGQELSDTQRKKLSKRIRRETRQAEKLDRRQVDLLDNSLEGLERLGHMQEGRLTDKGHWAANLCTTLVLELAEAIDAGLLAELDGTELLGLLGSISGDSYKKYLNIAENPVNPERYAQLQSLLTRVGEAYQRPGATDPVEVVPDAGLTVILWMQSQSWLEFAGILRLAGVPEGDVARLVTQTADHLHQISRLTESHPRLAELALEGRLGILKPPLTEVLAQTDLDTA